VTVGKAVVIGLARSGVGAANLLAREGEEVTVTDIRAAEELKGFAEELSPSVNLVVGRHPDWLFEDADLVVVSPGVPLGIRPVEIARRAGARVIGELELAYEHLSDLPFYAVTGTNGKSTTVTLLNLMLRRAGRRCIFGGNIGNALTAEALRRSNGGGDAAPEDCVVVEVSSFQLEAIESFRPRVASILNITPDHMDRYRTLDEYREAKRRIFANQRRGDWLVLNADDPETMKLRGRRRNVRFFSRRGKVNGVYLRGGTVCSSEHGPILEAGDIRIKGVHNLENAMAASAMALLAGCPPEAAAGVLREFQGLDHRLEFVRELGGVRYVNDSKGTNVGAVVKSLESFSQPVVLIAGGRDKAGDFSALRPLMDRVKAVVLIGEAAGKIRDALSDLVQCVPAGSMEDAVRKARELAAAGDVVLLSPACASFDMFRDFEDRGRRFEKAVMDL